MGARHVVGKEEVGKDQVIDKCKAQLSASIPKSIQI